MEYNSGSGNGTVGMGWQIKVPYLQRQTDKGLPLYSDADTIIDWTGEELVRLSDGSFRQENEFAFTRYSQTAENGWRAQLRNGTTFLLGQTPQSRLSWATNGTFCWNLESSQDPNGNRTEYSYFQDRQQIYLREIRYGLHATQPSDFYRVTFDYETNRFDPIVDYRPRFSCETRLRLSGVTVLLGERRIRHWRLTYHTNAPVSLLASMTMFGDERSRTNNAAIANEDFLPPTYFDYSRSGGTVWQMRTNELGFTVNFNIGEADLVDVNFDGLPDILLDDDNEGYMTSLNRGGTNRWGTLRQMVNSPAGDGTRLAAGTTWLADLRGDGRSALLLYDDAGHYFRRFKSPIEFDIPMDFLIDDAHFPLTDPNVRLVDLNADKAIDLMATDGDSLSFLINGQFNAVPGQRTNRFLLNRPTPVSGLRFQDGWQLADMNGDRLQDLVFLGLADEGGIQVCLHRGWGEFEPPYAMTGGPATAELGPRGISGLQLADLNQDGLADLIYVDSGDVRIWFQQQASRWGEGLTIQNPRIPDYSAETTAIRFADMNGNGSLDVVWFEAGRNDLRYLELNPGSKPWLLNRVSTTIGRSIDVGYQSSIDYMIEAARASNQWTSVAPFPLPVVSQIVESDGLGNVYTNQFTYRNPYYDGVEREFRGFEEAVRREIGNDAEGAPTLVTQFAFDTGAKVESLKGKPLRVIAADAAGGIFWKETNSWTSRVLPLNRAPGELRTNVFALQSRKITEVLERGPTNGAVSLQQDFDYDDFGNLIRHMDWGRLDAGNPPWDDERLVLRSFSAAYPSGQAQWLLDRPVAEDLQDENGAVVTRKHYFYDDETFAGDNLGFVSKGNVTLVREWINPGSLDPAEAARTRAAVRNEYDLYGNIVGTYDPLGIRSRAEAGHYRRMGFDPTLHTHPVNETNYTANPDAKALGDAVPYLAASAQYDLGLGLLERFADFNGNETRFTYDTFGRLETITKPGDSADLPTSRFTYRLNGALGSGRSVNWIETRQREVAGQNGTFDSRSYFDGLGRKLMTRAESEVPGRVIVSGATSFNARRGPWRAILPYSELGSLDFLPPVLTNAFVETHYDPLGRSLTVIQPLTTNEVVRPFSRTTYKPLTRLVEDEEQTKPGSLHAGAGMRYVEDGLRDKDGKGRLRIVQEIVKLTDEGFTNGTPTNWTTSYRYDLLDNFTGYTDSQNNQKEFRYDALSRKTFMNDPDRGLMFWSYDDASNLFESKDAKEQVIRYAYDGANRLLTEDYLDGKSPPVWGSLSASGGEGEVADVIYHYDLPSRNLDAGDTTIVTTGNTRGMLAWVEDLSGEEHTSYDARGRAEYVVKRIPDFGTRTLVSYKTTYQYDSLNRVRTLIYADNDEVSYGYNPRNLLQNITGGPSGFITSNINYRASGQLEEIRYGNGVTTTYGYDPRLRLNSLITAHASRTTEPMISFAYDFDAVSNIKQITDNRPDSVVPAGDKRRNTQVFAYDDLYRLTHAHYSFALPRQPVSNDGQIDYRYDRIGNMLSQTSGIVHDEKGLSVTDLGTMDSGGAPGRWNRNGRSAGDQPGPHALTKITPRSGSGGARVYPYDANGNMILIDGLTNTWDFKDRLIAVENDQMRAEYSYDYTDRRITKKVISKTNDIVSSIPEITLYIDRTFEVREHGAPVKYVWNGDTRVARVSGNLNANQRVQRFALQPGWNILALAVTLSNGAAQFRHPVVQQVYQQGSGLGEYSIIQSNQTLPAGTILRVQASSSGAISVCGGWSNPKRTNYALGRWWIPNASSELLDVASLLPSDAALWFFDPTTQIWRHRFVGALSSAGDHPSKLQPGEATFAVTSASFILEPPVSNLEIRYYHQDHLGSSSVMSDASGQLIGENNYYAFGHLRQQVRSRDTKEFYQFTQKERDAESELHCFEVRYLTSLLARFTRVDPLGTELPSEWKESPQKLNLYSYCVSRPQIFIDPNGTDVGNPDSTRNGSIGGYGQQARSAANVAPTPEGVDRAFLGQSYVSGSRDCSAYAAKRLEAMGFPGMKIGASDSGAAKIAENLESSAAFELIPSLQGAKKDCWLYFEAPSDGSPHIERVTGPVADIAGRPTIPTFGCRRADASGGNSGCGPGAFNIPWLTGEAISRRTGNAIPAQENIQLFCPRAPGNTSTSPSSAVNSTP